MLEIIKSVVACIEQHRLFPTQGTIVVAVSGGADSLCLLHLLHQLCGPGKRYPTVQLHVAHLNHMLRAQTSAQDATAVAQIAQSWGLPVSIGTSDVPTLARQEQRSIEDAARTARYRFLRTVAQDLAGPTMIAVAHHSDDQVETLLLHWLRGGGIASMIGLQPRQQDIIRPLLTLTHADTLAYCLQNNLTPLEDESNTDPRFLRNRIRHELLPLMETMNAGIRPTLLRSAEVLHLDAAWIEAQVDIIWPTVIITNQRDQISLFRDILLAQPLNLQRHILRRVTACLHGGQSPLELRHYKLIEHFLQRESGGEELMLHLPAGIHLLRKDTLVTFTLQNNRPARHTSLLPLHENNQTILPIPGHTKVPGTPWIASAEILSGEILHTVKRALQAEDWESVWRLLPPDSNVVHIDGRGIGDILYVRTRQAGDRIRPLGMAHEKKVQDILVDKHIARHEREQVPLFFSASHCIWLAGIYLDDRVRLQQNTQDIVRLTIIPN